MDKVDGDEVDSLATKISEGVFAMLSASLDTKLDQIAKSVSSVCESVKVVEKRVDAAEQRISDTEDTVTQLLAKLERTEARLSEAANRLDDQENRSRRNNIKIVNLPERTEGANAKEFFETWLPKTLHLKRSDKDRQMPPETKKSFRALGIPYRMLFPAALRIAHDNKVHLFKTPAEAQRYVEEMHKANT